MYDTRGPVLRNWIISWSENDVIPRIRILIETRYIGGIKIERDTVIKILPATGSVM